MSTSKLDTSGLLQPFRFNSHSAQLNIPAGSLRFRRNGIEFHCADPIPVWTEMTVELQSPRDWRQMECTGVVVACNRSNPVGTYVISMLLMNLSRRSQERLTRLAAEERV